jgi:hypothetical protein
VEGVAVRVVYSVALVVTSGGGIVRFTCRRKMGYIVALGKRLVDMVGTVFVLLVVVVWCFVFWWL